MQKHGAKPTVYKDPTKEGCEFLGWYIAGTLNKFDFNDPVTSDLQLVAQWRVKSYTVTLDTNGGEPLDDLAIDHGEQIAQLMATRTGYTLTGWTDADGNAVKFPITVTSDLALTAQWKLDAPDVTITADKSDKDAHTGDTVILTANPSHALGGATYTYQWYKGRKKIEGATEKTLEVTKDGEYTVDVVAHDGKNESAAATSNSITLAFEKHDVMLAFAHGEVERHANEIGGTFTNGLTIQVSALGAVVYASDNEDVATVDPATGEVTIKGVGEAVITAKIAETDTHEAAEASHKLTVTDHDSGTWQTVKEPTCTEAGSEQRVCEVCGEVLETREIAAKGHKDGEWVVTKQATCTEPGEKELHCATCGEVIKTEAIPATGHAATHVSAQDATCTEQGVIEHWACGTCGKLFADEACTVEMSQADTVAPALGHKLEQVVAVAPTIDKEGVEAHYRCTVCGELYWDAEGTKKVEHADDLVVEKLEAVTVTFDDCIDPKDDQVSVRLEKGGVISPDDIPADPSYEGCTFLGWFLFDEATQIWGDQFDPEAPVTHDVLVGAKWQKNDGSDGGATQKPSDKQYACRRSPLPSPMMRARRRWLRRVTARSRRWPPPLRRRRRTLHCLASIAAARTRRDFSLRRVAESRSSQEVSEARLVRNESRSSQGVGEVRLWKERVPLTSVRGGGRLVALGREVCLREGRIWITAAGTPIGLCRRPALHGRDDVAIAVWRGIERPARLSRLPIRSVISRFNRWAFPNGCAGSVNDTSERGKAPF